jgi:hypothetical protein
MIPARLAVAVAVAGVSFVAPSSFAQDPPPQAPPMKPVLAGKKFTPPVRGEATIDIIKAPTRRDGATLVTKIQAKNTSNAPIARLKVVETWFDKEGNMIPGGETAINGLLQPNEVGNLEIHTPVNTKMVQSQLQFSHANGTVKPHQVKSMDAAAAGGKEPAAKPAAATKKKK